jgi:hypothetical protein
MRCGSNKRRRRARSVTSPDAIEPCLAFEADAGAIAERQIAVVQLGVVGEAAEIAEHAGIGFGAAETQAGGDGERHLVAAVRKQQPPRPLMPRQHVQRLGILHDAVGLRRIDLDDVVALRLEAAEPHQILDVLRGKQILAGGERRVIGVGDLGQQCEIQRIARFFEPAQPERLKPARVSQRFVAAEF